MAEDVIQSKRIELLDDEGNVSFVLEGARVQGAGFVISTPEEHAPHAAIGLVGPQNVPFIRLAPPGDTDATIFATFYSDGRPFIQLTNPDGRELTITPQ